MNLIQTKTNAVEEMAALVCISTQDEDTFWNLKWESPKKSPHFLDLEQMHTCTPRGHCSSAGLFASFSLQARTPHQKLSRPGPQECQIPRGARGQGQEKSKNVSPGTPLPYVSCDIKLSLRWQLVNLRGHYVAILGSLLKGHEQGRWQVYISDLLVR